MNNLPALVTEFVGRRADVAEVKRALGSSRLVTLTGVAGVGKTRLALEVAEQSARLYDDAVWFVPLAELTDPDLLAETVVQSIGLLSQSNATRSALTEYLRNRHALLLLDNCEHLIEGAAGLVGELLSRCKNLTVLATSREPLRITGERLYHVPPLKFPDTDQQLMPGDGLRYESMNLFLRRAASVMPTFSITQDNQDAVAAICRHLDGLPLAIELAAVRLRTLPLGDLLARHNDRYGLLTQGNRDAAPRHRTLRAAFEWSYELCSPRERLLWSRLAVFVGGFELSDVQSVCAGEGLDGTDVVDVMAGLIDKSIVTLDPDRGVGRYRLLESVREYGLEQLRSRDEELTLRARHRDHYLELAEDTNRRWFGPDQGELFGNLRAEQANLRTALEFCILGKDGAQIGLRFTSALWAYWFASGLQREAKHWLERALAREAELSPALVAAVWAHGHFAALTGENAKALAILTEGDSLAEQLGDESMRAHMAFSRAIAALAGSDLEAGLARAEEALALEREVEPPNPHLNLALIVLGYARCAIGDNEEGQRLLLECKKLCDEHGDRWLRSWSLVLLGFAAWCAGDTQRAGALLTEALRDKREFRDLLGIALAAEFLAWTATTEGHPGRSARLLGICHTLWESLGAYLVRFEALLGWHEQSMATAREMIGRENFEAEFDRGSRMPRNEAISYALNENQEKTPVRRKSGSELPDLSKREQEVAKMVARGMSNKDIASTLFLGVRTVDTHVLHIFRKLGFNSRTELAAWVFERTKNETNNGQ